MSNFNMAIALALALLVSGGAVSAASSGPSRGILMNGTHAKKIVIPEPALSFTPMPSDVPGQVTIFSNLASKYRKGEYWCCSGYNIMGRDSGAGEQWIAAAFIPDADHTVTKIQVGAGWSQGTNGIVISLNKDDHGVPGNALKTWNLSSLPIFGTCCTVLQVSSRTGIPLSGGQQYWVMLSTNDSETDTVDGWNESDADQVDQATLASYSDNQWHVFQAAPGVAFSVKGSN